jgi:hypothetical protein
VIAPAAKQIVGVEASGLIDESQVDVVGKRKIAHGRVANKYIAIGGHNDVAGGFGSAGRCDNGPAFVSVCVDAQYVRIAMPQPETLRITRHHIETARTSVFDPAEPCVEPVMIHVPFGDEATPYPMSAPPAP